MDYNAVCDHYQAALDAFYSAEICCATTFAERAANPKSIESAAKATLARVAKAEARVTLAHWMTILARCEVVRAYKVLQCSRIPHPMNPRK